MTNIRETIGLPTVDPHLILRPKTEPPQAAMQLLDLRGGPTDPIRVRAIGMEVPGDPSAGLRRSNSFDATAEIDPRTGVPLAMPPHPWAFFVDSDGRKRIEATRRFARARIGINRLGSMERRGWVPTDELTRRQLFPLDPPRLIWLDGEAWATDEVCCVDPGCDCLSLRVEFESLLLGDRSGAAGTIKVDLRHWSLIETRGEGPLTALGQAWLSRPNAQEETRALIDRAHAAGADLLDSFAARHGMVDGGARCPCGSRRKYKRCCSALNPAPIPGDLHALQARAHAALLAFAAQELGESTTSEAAPPVPSMASRQAWLNYWRHVDGFTLADRYLADPERGDLWLRRWMEAASGTPLNIFEVLGVQGSTARLGGLADPTELERDVVLATRGALRPGDLVLGAPVRLMGRTVLEGGWRIGGSKEFARILLEPLADAIERLCAPERVLKAMMEVAAVGLG